MLRRQIKNDVLNSFSNTVLRIHTRGKSLSDGEIQELVKKLHIKGRLINNPISLKARFTHMNGKLK